MLIVLLGAFLHAAWNALVKSATDKLIDTSLILGGAAVLSVLALPFLPIPAMPSWPYAFASFVIHIGYFALVAAAYRFGDMSYCYPLMRGTGPLIVAVLSGVVIGETLSPLAWAGVLLVCGGVLGLTLAYRHPTGGSIALPTLFALANACVIALYTFVDGIGVRLSGSPVAYTMWGFLLCAIALIAWVTVRRPAAVAARIREQWLWALIGGACTLVSYVLALWAMTRAPIAPVAALRETSILFGMLLASFALKERFGWARPAAAAIVVCGIAALRLG